MEPLETRTITTFILPLKSADKGWTWDNKHLDSYLREHGYAIIYRNPSIVTLTEDQIERHNYYGERAMTGNGDEAIKMELGIDHPLAKVLRAYQPPREESRENC